MDQVSFWTYDDNKWGDWASFRFTQPHPSGTVGQTMRIEHHEIDTTLERSGAISGKATTTFMSQRNGLRVVRLSLFPTCGCRGLPRTVKPWGSIQEDKNDDSNFAVILPKALAEAKNSASQRVIAERRQ